MIFKFGAARKHKNVGWRRESPAMDTFTHLIDDFVEGKVESEAEPPFAKVAGKCFVCFGSVSATTPLELFAPDYYSGPTGQSARSELYVDVLLSCNCGHSHPAAPSGVKGCGRSFAFGVPCG